MKRREFIKAFGAAAAAWPFAANAQPLSASVGDSRSADLIISGGNILTQNPSEPVVQALAVKGERILAVGAAGDIASLRGPQTRLIDLAGRTVLPGIIDAHAHMEREALKEQRISLAGLRSVGDILNVIRTAVQRAKLGEWIVTMPVGDPPYYFGGPEVLTERRMPSRSELDRVAPDNPVYISGSFNNWGEPPGYSALNSLALRISGITAATVPTCSGVEIVKDASGEPTGLIIETNDRPTVEFDLLKAVPKFTWQQRLDAIRASMKLYNAVGTTSAYEGHGSSPETLALYRALWERGELSVRMSLVVSPTWTNSAQAMRDLRDLLPYASGQGLGDRWLRVSGVFIGQSGEKAFRDASLAALPDTGWSGFVEYANTLSEYRDYVMTAAELGFRVHSIAANNLDKVLAIWAEADERFNIKQKRWVIEHLAIVKPAEAAMIKRLGVHVTTIPSKTFWKRGPRLATQAGNAEFVTPHRTFLNEGIPNAIGTDNVPYSQFFPLWNVTTRQCRNGEVVGPGQRLTVAEALPLFTREGARLSFDDQKGTLRAGMLADFAVLDRDLMSTRLDDIKDIRAQTTVVGGRIVHEA
uniref:amidohydrolase n=1 Tax=Rhodoplanes sp. Z2-YC6860 TaxID=674703 RepID=UPI00078D3758|nr:amidohydrolase [Rhodoplanes sp. Z2-YC6860]AMN40685.1 metallo-dependent hydrolase [Rhodoplanes sp. Z2-YC6860]